ncbi:MAG: hypothetical protein Ct9H300mP19_14840 [Dehalococcoidia bacterium]|nr:MAG: hypothetical protein Ct9H300mP19_14840 [Dehalococcoidia bacterium]
MGICKHQYASLLFGGKKSIGYELAEQLGWRAPSHIIVPVASGSLFTKVFKGLNEFAELGIIDSNNSKMHIAQPAGCSPVATAFVDGQTHPKPVIPDTIAKSLAIGSPADGFIALKSQIKLVDQERLFPNPRLQKA